MLAALSSEVKKQESFMLTFHNPIYNFLLPFVVSWFIEMFCIEFHKRTIHCCNSGNIGHLAHSRYSEMFNKAGEAELQRALMKCNIFVCAFHVLSLDAFITKSLL